MLNNNNNSKSLGDEETQLTKNLSLGDYPEKQLLQKSLVLLSWNEVNVNNTYHESMNNNTVPHTIGYLIIISLLFGEQDKTFKCIYITSVRLKKIFSGLEKASKAFRLKKKIKRPNKTKINNVTECQSPKGVIEWKNVTHKTSDHFLFRRLGKNRRNIPL